MRPSEFPEQTVVWAEDQPPYLPLPAWTDGQETRTLWQLTWCERLTVLLTGRLWLRQLNFGRPLQPQRPQVESPFTLGRGFTFSSPGVTLAIESEERDT